MRIRRFTLTLLLSIGLFTLANAAVNTWAPPSSNSQSWANAVNWSLGRVPNTTDTVIIGANAVQINFPNNITVRRLVCLGGTFVAGSTNGRTITISEGLEMGNIPMYNISWIIQANATMNLNAPNQNVTTAGSITVLGTLNLNVGSLALNTVGLNVSGVLNWTAGELKSPVLVQNNGVFNIQTTGNHLVSNIITCNGVLNVLGGNLTIGNSQEVICSKTVNFSTAGNIVGYANSTNGKFILNTANAVFNVGNNMIFSPQTEFYLNATTTLNLGSNSTLKPLSNFYLYGKVLGGNSSKLLVETTVTTATSTIVDVNTVEVTTGGVLSIAHGSNFMGVEEFKFLSGSTTISGSMPLSAQYWVANNATVNTSQNALTAGNFQLTGGTWTNGNIKITANSLWAGTSLSGNIEIQNGATLTAGNATMTTMNASLATITNHGILKWTKPGTITFTGTIQNYGTMYISGPVFKIEAQNGGYYSAGTFENIGTINIENTATYVRLNSGAGFTNHPNGLVHAAAPVRFETNSLENYGAINVGGGSLKVTGFKMNLRTGSETLGLDSLICESSGFGTIEGGTEIEGDTTVFVWDVPNGHAGHFSIHDTLPPESSYFLQNARLFTHVSQTFDGLVQIERGDGMLGAAGTGSSTLTINGDLVIKGGNLNIPTIVAPSGVVRLRHFLTYNGYAYSARINAAFTNYGTTVFEEGDVVLGNYYAPIINEGVFEVDALTPVVHIQTGSLLVNNGEFWMCNAASDSVFIYGQVENNGTIEGAGELMTHEFIGNGDLAPGCGIGHLRIHSAGANASASANQVLNIEINSATEYDKVMYVGNLQAGGTLNVTMPSGIALTAPLMIVETTGYMIGAFNQINLPSGYEAVYHSNGLTMQQQGPLSVNPTDLVMPAVAGNANFTINSTLNNWTITDNATWASVSPATGSQNATPTVTVGANTSNSVSRTSIVTVRKGSNIRTITVTQASANGQVCRRVLSPSLANIGADEVTFQWINAVGADTYEVFYRQQGTSAWTKIAVSYANSVNVSGLLPSTSYQWRMRSRCASNSVSDYTPIVTFTTTAYTGSTANRNQATNEKSEILGQISFYPNPANQFVYFEWEIVDGKQPASISFFDVTGRLVHEINQIDSNPMEISVDRLGEGIKVAVVKSADGEILLQEKVVISPE